MHSVKNILRVLIALAGLLYMHTPLVAQLVNNGGTINISAGAQLISARSIANNAGTINNDGTIKVGGDLIHTAPITNGSTSAIHFNGLVGQTIYGVPVTGRNVVINNLNGVALTTDLSVTGNLNFLLGNITTRHRLVIFTPGSSHAGAADTSHVDGAVRYDGTGNFTYPVGNSDKFQPLAVNLVANTGGLVAEYFVADAGTAVFSTAGSSAVPLVSYNDKEYWALQQVIAGAGNVAGSVTIFWDGYKDYYNTPTYERKVARRFNNEWRNEGGNATGTTLTGSIESNPLSNWGVFALGSVNNPLPLKWLWVNGALNTAGKAEINWSVSEQGTLGYEVEKSRDGIEFSSAGSVAAKGDGMNVYHFTEDSVLEATAFYRVKQLDKNGNVAYSSTLKIVVHTGSLVSATLYPSVVTSTATIRVLLPAAQKISYAVSDVHGRIITRKTMWLQKGTNHIPLDANQLSPGVYTVSVINEAGQSKSIPFVKP